MKHIVIFVLLTQLANEFVWFSEISTITVQTVAWMRERQNTQTFYVSTVLNKFNRCLRWKIGDGGGEPICPVKITAGSITGSEQKRGDGDPRNTIRINHPWHGDSPPDSPPPNPRKRTTPCKLLLKAPFRGRERG